MSYLREIWNSRELLHNLTNREVRGKYRRTALGQLWSLANPVAAILIYTFIFSFIFRLPAQVGDPSGIDNYALWLVCGLLPWLFFNRVLTLGVDSLVANAGLIQKVYFPRIVLAAIAHQRHVLYVVAGNGCPRRCPLFSGLLRPAVATPPGWLYGSLRALFGGIGNGPFHHQRVFP